MTYWISSTDLLTINAAEKWIVQKTLYLDTARMGQMSPQALDASLDFARFAHEYGSTLYFSLFLNKGFSSWPAELQAQYPGLSNWDGVKNFQDRLRRLAGADTDSHVFIASRSTFFMQCAARLLTGPCRNVLITDCTWPAYARILREQCQLSHTAVSVCPIRKQILEEQWSVEAVIEKVTKAYLKQQCDGLFLPLIDNLGIRLPVERIVSEIQKHAELRFVVVDGAQAVGQIDPHLDDNYCDFFIAGTHKWLRGFYPMGIGYCGRPESATYVADSLRRWQQSSLLADPLLNFTNELTGSTSSQFGETVNVAPLIVANAATSRILRQSESFTTENRCSVTQTVRAAGWKVIDVAAEMRSCIILAEPPTKDYSPLRIRQTLQQQGLAATVYNNGVVRISLPQDFLNSEHLSRVLHALKFKRGKRLEDSVTTSQNCSPTFSKKRPLPVFGTSETGRGSARAQPARESSS